MTAQFWLWVVLSGLGGGIVGWWIRSRQASGRELTIKREWSNRLGCVEDDARVRLARAREESDAQLARLASERDALRDRLRGPGAPSAEPVPQTPVRAASRPGRRPRSAPRPSENGAPAEPAPSGDDLKRISGIGPAYERLLNELGYHTFRDVAGWGPSDFERIARRLGGRARPGAWVVQAGELDRAKHGAPI